MTTAPTGHSSQHSISEIDTERQNAYLQTIFHGERAELVLGLRQQATCGACLSKEHQWRQIDG